VNWSYYRKIPATATEKSSEAPSSSQPSAGSAVSTSPTSTPTVDPAPEKSESKAWIAGAVIGPIVGIALIAGLIFFFMRRKKKTPALPQSGTVAMGGPPPGVQPYTDAKPQMSPDPAYAQTATAYNANDPYNNQYGQPPTSPAPQYQQTPAAGVYAPDNKNFYPQQGHPEAAELGGGTTRPTAGASHTAELPAESGPK
jgi:LPXTG-motif cell wall-anchored protein